MKKINYTKELLLNAVNKCYSIAEVCRELGLKPVGENYHTIKKRCQEYNIDISHFVGKDWNKNPHLTNGSDLNEVLKDQVNFKSTYLKKRLIKAGLKTDVCECCKTPNVWQGKPITLELHHINGNHYDNRLENLQILCPNCHSLQEGHKVPKTNKIEVPTAFRKRNEELKKCNCLYCHKDFQSDRLDRTRKFCSIKCYRDYVAQFGTDNIQERKSYSSFSEEDLKIAMENSKTITDIAKKLKCNRGTAREYLLKFGLYDSFKNKTN